MGKTDVAARTVLRDERSGGAGGRTRVRRGAGGVAVGYVFGLGLIAAGVLRLWIARKAVR